MSEKIHFVSPYTLQLTPWVGCKRRLLPLLDTLMPKDFDQYSTTWVEPFVGAGGMLFHTLEKYPCIQEVIINDFNEEMYGVYVNIRDNLPELMEELRELEREYFSSHDKEQRRTVFTRICQEYNQRTEHTSIHISAMFLYICKHGFNGIYRVDKGNRFNNGCGYRNYTFDYSAFYEISKYLRGVIDIRNVDFQECIESVLRDVPKTQRVFFYLDPPYYKAGVNYCPGGFPDSGYDRIDECLREIDKAGHKFMLSNSYHEDLLERYKMWNVKDTERWETIPQEKRRVVKELIIRNYE